uniref:Uncharacterized protein n=1 Tax=Arundo donax TaxID=35708 RepID=A0A0A9C0W4_ARUDO
MLLLSYLQ